MQLDLLTSLREVSRAKTSVGLDLVTELVASVPGCGVNTAALLARYDHDSSSWRTSQRCFLEEWELFAVTWPESGMTQNGQLLQHAPWVRHTCDRECSLWPTPTASMDGRGFGIPLHKETGRYKRSTILRVHALIGEHGWRIHPNFTEALMGYPMDHTETEGSAMRSSPRSQK